MISKSGDIFYIYILECQNGTFYTGYTTDIKRRYKEHLTGTGKCKYTRAFPPNKIACCWKIHSTKSNVMRIEHIIKKLTKTQKEELIANWSFLSVLLSERDFDLGSIDSITLDSSIADS